MEAQDGEGCGVIDYIKLVSPLELVRQNCLAAGHAIGAGDYLSDIPVLAHGSGILNRRCAADG